MKRILKVVIIAVILVLSSSLTVKADTLDDLTSSIGAESLSENLPEEAYDFFDEIGIDCNDYNSIKELSFSKVLGAIFSKVSNEASQVIPSVCTLVAFIILYSVFDGVLSGGSNPALSSVLSVATSLCMACLLLVPVTDLIDKTYTAVKLSSDFMLAFIPVMVTLLISSGKTSTGSGYSAMMLLCAQGVSQYFSKFIAPLLNCFLALGVSSSIVPEIKLSGIIGSFSKCLKWLMAFVFSLFTFVLALKTVFSSSVDNLSSKAMRYTVSSFVPVVGGALSEAYRTVHSSLGVLKSGVGVFSIISVVAVFLPVVIRILLWLFSLNLCKSFAETTSLTNPVDMINAITMVLSLLFSVVLCVVSLFIISTALVIIIGGA